MSGIDYYAFLDSQNIVVDVMPGNLQQGSPVNWEEYYEEKRRQTCKRTSIDGSFRKNYAGKGYTYNYQLDAFIPPRPQPGEYWTLDQYTCRWVNTPAGAQFYITEAVKQHLDSVAAERQYDGIVSLIGYLNSPVAKWAAEASAGNVWRSAVWVKVYDIQQQVISGQRPIPTPTEVIAELPVIQWPPA